MLLLIVEDNAFNAFCLSRIITATLAKCQIHIANDSVEALAMIAREDYDAIIIDGDLGAGKGLRCNGPELANIIWSANPETTIVAWSDSSTMQKAFSDVFRRHKKVYEQYCWPKMVSEQKILTLWHYPYPSFSSGQKKVRMET